MLNENYTVMAINDAMKFIKESQKSKELRKEVNKLQPEEIFPKLTELGYDFNAFEFDEAVNLLHVQCQFQEDAEHLLQTSMWFKMQTGDPL